MAKVKVTDSVSELVTRSPIELFWTAKKNVTLIQPGRILPWFCLLHCDCPDELVECSGRGGRQGDARGCRLGDVAQPPHHGGLLGEGGARGS